MENYDQPGTIIVKAPNQQIEDQTIHCELSWTIKRLKNHLSEVYPNKPKIEEQKLIYLGQLLNDSTVLKDVLRQYDGQDTHTVHLVLTPKSRHIDSFEPKSTSNLMRPPPVPPTTTSSTTPAASNSSDGLRNRVNANQNTYQSIPNNQTQSASGYSYFPYDMATMSSYPHNQHQQMMLAQTIALTQQWQMQEIYMQYMNQYMNSAQMNSNLLSQRPSVGVTSSEPSNISSLPYIQQHFSNINFWQQQQQQQYQQLHEMQQPEPQPHQPQPNAAVAGAEPQIAGAAAVGAVDNIPADGQPQRFPNVVQDEVENRDWLDLFYATSRLMVLVSLVYFYSSPVRCLIVIFFIILYYLYHTGFFRQLQQQTNNNQIQPAQAAAGAVAAAVADPPAPAGQAAADIDGMPVAAAGNGDQEGVEADGEVAVIPGAVEDGEIPTESSNDTIAQDQNNTTPVIALIRTFILSFFASLIPETPAL